MKHDMVREPDKAYKVVKDSMEKNNNLTLLDPIGFNNTWTFAMKPEIAAKYGIETYSDLSKYAKDLTLACTLEFANREDAYLGIKKLYNMNFKDVKAIDGSLRYTAVEKDEAQVIDANSTEGLVQKFKFKILEDDKGFFPPYYAVPIVREDTLKKYPELKEVLNKLSGKIDDKTMADLNYQVDNEGKSPEEVAHNFLVEKNLIKK
jgi:osmoprotectant transport system permease protein